MAINLRLPAMPLEKPTLWMTVRLWSEQDNIKAAKPRIMRRLIVFFLPLAQGGNSEAARFVGLMKLTGKGTARDTKSARQWLSIAAQGDKVAFVCSTNTNHFFKASALGHYLFSEKEVHYGSYTGSVASDGTLGVGANHAKML